MKRLISLLGVSAIVAGMFAMAAGTPARAEDPTKTPFVPVGSQEGVLTVWVDDGKAPIVESLGAKFEKATGVKVRLQVMGFGDIRSNFNIAGPAGEGPDLIVAAHDWAGELYSNGLLATVDVPKDVLAKYDPVGVQAMSYDGKLIGLPYAVEAVALYYNKDLVPTPPATWDDAVALSAQLVKDGKVDQGFAIPTNDPYHTYPLLSSFGGFVFGRDANGNYDSANLGIDSPGALKGAEYLDKLVKDGVIKATVDGNVAKDLFMKGRLAMFVSGPWNLGDIRKSGVNFGVTKIPAGTEAAHPFVGVQGFMISAKSKNLALAQAFLAEYVSTDEAQKAIFDAKPIISAWLPTRELTLKDDADLSGFAASAADGQPMPAIPQMGSFWGATGNAITLIYQQKEAPDKAFTDAAAAIRADIAKAK